MVTKVLFLAGTMSLLLLAASGNADEPIVEPAGQGADSPAIEPPQKPSRMGYDSARKELLSHLADFAADRYLWQASRAESFPNADLIYDHRIWVMAPAVTELNELRDEARRNVMAGKDVRDSFQALKSINELFGEQAMTNEVFAMLDETRPELAKAVFDVIKPSLVESKSYAMLGKYIAPNDDFAQTQDAYRKANASETLIGVGHWGMANKQFAHDAMRLVAILSIAGRGKDAEQIAALAVAEWDNRAFRSDLRNALEGVIPDPLPWHAQTGHSMAIYNMR